MIDIAHLIRCLEKQRAILLARDSDRSGEAGETSTQIEGSTEGESAGRSGAEASPK